MEHDDDLVTLEHVQLKRKTDSSKGSNFKLFQKSSYASVQQPSPNASQRSKSIVDSLSHVITFTVGFCDQPCLPYVFKDVLGFVPNSTDHNTVRDSVIYWLKKKLLRQKAKGKFAVLVGREYTLEFREDTLCDSSKVADIVIRGMGDIAYVQFEVESSAPSRGHTLRKLAYGLVDQLIYARNRHNTVQSVFGFYISVQGGFEKLHCKWVDEKFWFLLVPHQLQLAGCLQHSLFDDPTPGQSDCLHALFWLRH